MEWIYTAFDSLSSSTSEVSVLFAFIPKLFAVVVLVLIGWWIAAGLAELVAQVIRLAKLDKALETTGINKIVEKGGYKLNSGKFIGELVKWFVILVFWIAAFDILKLDRVGEFLEDVVDYIPQLIAAVLILVVGVIVADFLKKTVAASSKATGIKSANFLGSATKWVVLVIAIFTAAEQIGINLFLLQTIIQVVLAGFVLALALAFGLGGRDAAADAIKKLSSEFSDRD